MRFALDTFREITGNDPDRRRHALFTFVLWFIAGAFVISTLQFYFLPYEGIAAQLIGGTFVSLAALCLKFT